MTDPITVGNVANALIPDRAGVLAPSYSLAKLYATIKKYQIDDGVYFTSLSTALQAGIPFEYKFNGFHQTKGADSYGGTTMRYEIMANSVDLALMTFHSSTGHLVDGMVNAAGLAGNVGDIYKEQYPSLNAKALSILGKESSFTTNYFQRKGDAIDKTVFYVNGERIPQYDMKNPQVYNQSLIVLVSATMFQVVSTMTSIHTNRGKKITGLLLPDNHTYVVTTLFYLVLTLTVFL